MSPGLSCLLAVVLCGVVAVTANAQRATGVQQEWRLDAVAGNQQLVLAGLGVNVVAGTYTRLVVNALGGRKWSDGGNEAAFQLEGAARFVLDPFRESALGLYGLGGISLRYAKSSEWQPFLLIGVGLERSLGPSRLLALEVALGGGARVGVVVRRARAQPVADKQKAQHLGCAFD